MLKLGGFNQTTMTMRLHCRRKGNCITMRETPDQELTMPAVMEVESTLTDRYQTTVPETVRRALRLGKRDKIHYTIRPSGEVVLTRAESASEDPVLSQFLAFLARDIGNHPEQLQSLEAGLVQRLRGLTDKVEVDLDAPLSADDE